jgi:two-component system response regulator AtoC
MAPRLEDRREDVAPLAREFVRRYADKVGVATPLLADARVRKLELSHVAGPLGQLENVVARMVAMSSGGVLDVEAFVAPGARIESSSVAPPPMERASDSGAASLKEQVEAFERSLIGRALEASNGNQSEAARNLGMSRPTLIDKMKKYGFA